MPRFDIYRNPNPRASHALYLDVQSDLVTTATRWCIPLFAASPSHALVGGAQVLLAVPATFLRNPVAGLARAINRR